jgi:hypothetical protein
MNSLSPNFRFAVATIVQPPVNRLAANSPASPPPPEGPLLRHLVERQRGRAGLVAPTCLARRQSRASSALVRESTEPLQHPERNLAFRFCSYRGELLHRRCGQRP